MTLNNNSYYAPKNYITNSKIKDWLFCKNYFYRKHLLQEIKEKKTDALLIGSAVDCFVFDGKEVFENNYIQVSRRDLKNASEKEYIELNATQYNAVLAMGEAITNTEAFKYLVDNKFEFQRILKVDFSDTNGFFTGFCGKPDAIKIDLEKDEATIVDLKTTTCDNPRQYHYHCLEYGYYRQQACYSLLVNYLYPSIKKISCKHLALIKNADTDLILAKTYTLSKSRIDNEKENVKSIIKEILAEKKFEKSPVSWDNSILIGEEVEEI